MKKPDYSTIYFLFTFSFLLFLSACKKEDCGLAHCQVNGNFLSSISIDGGNLERDTFYTRDAVIPIYVQDEFIQFENYLIPISESDQVDFFYTNEATQESVRINFVDDFEKVIAVITIPSVGDDIGYTKTVVGDRTERPVTLSSTSFHDQFEGVYETKISRYSTFNYGSSLVSETTGMFPLAIEEGEITFGDTVMYYQEPFLERMALNYDNYYIDTTRKSYYFSLEGNGIALRMSYGIQNEEGNIVGEEVFITATK